MTEKHKPPEEVEQPRLFTYAEFFSRNKWRIIAGVSLVAGILVVIGLVQFIAKRKEAKAFQAYVKAENAKEYRMVEANFPGTVYGALSLVEAGKSLYKEGEYGQARQEYLRLLKDYPESPLRPWANNLIGATFEAEGKYDQAIQYYRKAEASNVLSLQAKFNIGRCYEFKGDSETDPQVKLNNYALARSYYRQLTEAAPSSPETTRQQTAWQQPAQTRVNFLREK